MSANANVNPHAARRGGGAAAWHGRIREVTSWIARNPGERITVEGLARRAKMTPRQLRGAFRGILGTSVTAFVRLQRLAAARRLLETTSDSVSDVAQACGFYDHSHFANAFRRAYGRSPGAWRAGRRGAGRGPGTR